MEEQAESLLRELGLSEYETKACMVLVRFGSSDANRISSIGNIPLPRVYDTMESLSKRGLISVSMSRPQTFSIINLKKFFEILKADEKKKIDEKIRSIEDVSSRFLKLVPEVPIKNEELGSESLTLTKRSMNVEEIWDKLQEETKQEFHGFRRGHLLDKPQGR